VRVSRVWASFMDLAAFALIFWWVSNG